MSNLIPFPGASESVNLSEWLNLAIQFCSQRQGFCRYDSSDDILQNLKDILGEPEILGDSKIQRDYRWPIGLADVCYFRSNLPDTAVNYRSHNLKVFSKHPEVIGMTNTVSTTEHFV